MFLVDRRSGRVRFAALVLALAIMSTCGSALNPGPAAEQSTTATSSSTTVLGPTSTSTSAPATTEVPAVQATYVASDIDDPEHLPFGETVFKAQCASCHGRSGQGTPLAPSLVGIAQKQPDRLDQIYIATYGIGEMLPRPGWLTPEEVDAVVSYIRLTFIAEPGGS